MGKKNYDYICLKDVDHKLQYVNFIGVINAITPIIKRKKLCKIELEICDATLSNPGFCISVELEIDMLDQFLATAKRGLIIELLEIKIAKNDGEVKGEVKEEEEIQMYKDDGTNIKWWLGQKKCSTSDKVKCAIEKLNKWKKVNFKETFKTNILNKSFQSDSSSELSTRSFGMSKKTSTSNENSPKHQENKKRGGLADISIEDKGEKPLRKVNKPTVTLAAKNNNTDANISENHPLSHPNKDKMVTDQSSQKIDRKRKLIYGKTSKSHSVSPIGFHHVRQGTTRRSLKEITVKKSNSNSSMELLDDKSPRNNSVSPNVLHSKKANTSLLSSSETKQKSKSPRKSLLEHSNRSLRSLSNSPYSTSSKDSTSSLSKKRKLNEEESYAKANELKKENLKIVKGKEIFKQSFQNSSGTTKTHLKNANKHKRLIIANTKNLKQLESHPRKSLIGIASSSKSSKQDISDSRVDKISTCNLDKSPSKQTININKVDKISTHKADKGLSKRGIEINEVDKISTRNADKGLSKQGIEINKVDKISSNTTDKSPSKQGIEKVDKISARNADKIPSKQGINFNKVKKINTHNLERSPLNQSIEIKKMDKISTRNLDKSLDKQNSSIRGKLLNTTIQQGNSNKLTRKSKSPKDTGAKDLINSLSLLTRKVHLVEVESTCDVSFCELEDIDVPYKVDLNCKILSEFSMFEENIQIIRVQDGTISKCPTLSVPLQASWEEIVATVVKNPTVQKNTPYIDIIIFDFLFMDTRVLSGQFYEFKNIMAVRLNLKDDPRKGAKPRNELFFCAKGPSTYVKKLKQKHQQEIEIRLNEEKYKKLCSGFLDDKSAENKISIMQVENVSAYKKQNIVREESDNSSDLEFLSKSLQNSKKSPTNRKRKLSHMKLDSKDSPVSNKKSKKVVCEKNLIDDSKKESPKEKRERCNEKSEPDVGITISSDETMLGETECLIIQELSEIMHEESQLGLPQMYTEDIHLQNSGSEVTFSQFCGGAKAKAANFRTSTQNDSLSDNIVPLNEKETILSVDSNKMEPLVYCPSSPSLSENISPIKHSKAPEMLKGPKECSESILQSYTLKAIPEADRRSLKLKSDNKKESETNPPTNSDVLSVEVISSTSSDLEFEVVNVKDSSNGNNNCNHCHRRIIEKLPKKRKNNFQKQIIEHALSKSVPHSEGHSSERSKVSAPKTTRSVECDIELQTTSENVVKITEDNNSDKVEVVSDSNSSILSDTSVSILSDISVKGNITSVGCERLQGNSTNCLLSPGQSGKKDYCNGYFPSTDNECKKIPEDCFFKSSRNNNPSAEDINYIFDDDNSSLKYFSYSLDRDLPFLTFDVIRKVGNKNYITVAVTIEKISPSFTDSWKEEFIKSRCSCCNKMYNAYYALNNKLSENTSSLDALSVSGLIVCPESQCCNQVLDTPEFHFSVNTKLKDGSPVTALIAGKYAEKIFGCKAQEAARDETALNHIKEILQQIASKIAEKQTVRVEFARENICNPKSGPLFIQKFHF